MPSQPPMPPSPTNPAPPEISPTRRVARRRFGYVNWVLILGSVAIALLSSLGEDQEKLLPFFISLQPAYSPNCLLEVRHGEVWRLFTPAFLHFGIVHLGFNMMGLKNIGDPMEVVHGWRFYLVLTTVLGVCSSLGQYFITGSPFFGGMSGILYGLFGYLWTRGVFDPVYPLRLPKQTVIIALVWFVACFSGVLGPIANSAHTVGLVMGAVWGLLASRRAMARMAGPRVRPTHGSLTSGVRATGTGQRPPRR